MTACCDNPAHDNLGFVDAEVLRVQHAERQAASLWLTNLLAATPDADTIALNRVGIASEIAAQLSYNPGVLRSIFMDAMRGPVREASRVRTLQHLIRAGTETGPPRQVRNAARELQAVGGQDAIDRADRCDALMAAFAGGIFLAGQARHDEMVNLSRAALDTSTELRPTMAVRVPTLADSATRDRLKLSGHSTIREHSLGHQRQRLGLHGAVRHHLPAANGHGNSHSPLEIQAPDMPVTDAEQAAEAGTPAPGKQEVAAPGSGRSRSRRRGSRQGTGRRGKKR